MSREALGCVTDTWLIYLGEMSERDDVRPCGENDAEAAQE